MPGTVRRRLHRPLTLLWPVTVVGLVLGGLVGLLIAMSGARSASAATLIGLEPAVNPSQILSGAPPSADAPQAYLADQLAYLTSDGYRRAVADDLNDGSPVDLTATQEGQSMVVRISATADQASRAAKIVDSAVAVYRRHADEASAKNLQTARDAVDKVIADIQSNALAQVGGDQAAVDQAFLNDQLATLRGQRVSLDVAQRRGAGVQVVDPTLATEVAGSVSPLLGVVGGAFLGGIVGLGCGLWWRSRSGVITSVDALEAEIAPVARPVVTLSPRSGALVGAEVTVARTLYSQLQSPRGGRVVVVGAQPSSGAEAVGRLLFHAFEEHGSSAVVAPDDLEMDRAQMDALPEPAHTTIVVGRSLGTAPLLVELLPNATHVVFVVRIGVDTASQVAVLNRSVAALDVPTTVIATRSTGFGSGAAGDEREHPTASPSGDVDAGDPVDAVDHDVPAAQPEVSRLSAALGPEASP